MGPQNRRNHAFSGRGVLSAWSLLILLLCACQPAPPAIDHLAVAKQLASQIAASPAGENLSDPAYEQVAQELQLVPEDSAQKAEASAWLKKIQDARRSKLFAVDDGPNNPAASERKRGSSSHPARPAKPVHSGTVEGWNSYEAPAAGKSDRGASGNEALASAGEAPARSDRQASRRTQGLAVTVYSASWCGVCKQAKAYLSQKGIPYTEKDIERDPVAKAEVISKVGSTKGIPVIDVNGSVLVGFDQNALDQMIRKVRTQ